MGTVVICHVICDVLNCSVVMCNVANCNPVICDVVTLGQYIYI